MSETKTFLQQVSSDLSIQTAKAQSLTARMQYMQQRFDATAPPICSPTPDDTSPISLQIQNDMSILAGLLDTMTATMNELEKIV